MAAAAPDLNNDVTTDILIRLPPDEPAHLVRVSLICKSWRRIVSDGAFLRRYRRFHRTPPLLGFFNDMVSGGFIPITTAFSFSKAAFDCCSCYVLDCRHGRVLGIPKITDDFLVVWVPIISEREEVRTPNIFIQSFVVLCAAAGCDHCNCHGGPFLVICVGTNSMDDSVDACVYSSQVGAWADLVSVHLDVEVEYLWDQVNWRSGPPVGDGIYFVLALGVGDRILKYDLGTHCLSTIDLPDLNRNTNVVLMPTEEGMLGLASTRASTLCLWSRMVNGEGVAGWVQSRVIDLQTVLPVTFCIDKVKVMGFAKGVNVIFVSTNAGTFIIYLKSGLAMKVSDTIYNPVLPFVSFYTADYACSKLTLPTETN